MDNQQKHKILYSVYYIILYYIILYYIDGLFVGFMQGLIIVCDPVGAYVT
jgi:hypothetical protein